MQSFEARKAYLASLPPDYVPSRAELAEHGFFPYAPLRPVVNYVGRGSLPDGEVEEPDEDEADGTAGGERGAGVPSRKRATRVEREEREDDDIVAVQPEATVSPKVVKWGLERVLGAGDVGRNLERIPETKGKRARASAGGRGANVSVDVIGPNLDCESGRLVRDSHLPSPPSHIPVASPPPPNSATSSDPVTSELPTVPEGNVTERTAPSTSSTATCPNVSSLSQTSPTLLADEGTSRPSDEAQNNTPVEAGADDSKPSAYAQSSRTSQRKKAERSRRLWVALYSDIVVEEMSRRARDMPKSDFKAIAREITEQLAGEAIASGLAYPPKALTQAQIDNALAVVLNRLASVAQSRSPANDLSPTIGEATNDGDAFIGVAPGPDAPGEAPVPAANSPAPELAPYIDNTPLAPVCRTVDGTLDDNTSLPAVHAGLLPDEAQVGAPCESHVEVCDLSPSDGPAAGEDCMNRADGAVEAAEVGIFDGLDVAFDNFGSGNDDQGGANDDFGGGGEVLGGETAYEGAGPVERGHDMPLPTPSPRSPFSSPQLPPTISDRVSPPLSQDNQSMTAHSLAAHSSRSSTSLSSLSAVDDAYAEGGATNGSNHDLDNFSTHEHSTPSSPSSPRSPDSTAEYDQPRPTDGSARAAKARAVQNLRLAVSQGSHSDDDSSLSDVADVLPHRNKKSPIQVSSGGSEDESSSSTSDSDYAPVDGRKRSTGKKRSTQEERSPAKERSSGQKSSPRPSSATNTSRRRSKIPSAVQQTKTAEDETRIVPEREYKTLRSLFERLFEDGVVASIIERSSRPSFILPQSPYFYLSSDMSAKQDIKVRIDPAAFTPSIDVSPAKTRKRKGVREWRDSDWSAVPHALTPTESSNVQLHVAALLLGMMEMYQNESYHWLPAGVEQTARTLVEMRRRVRQLTPSEKNTLAGNANRDSLLSGTFPITVLNNGPGSLRLESNTVTRTRWFGFVRQDRLDEFRNVKNFLVTRRDDCFYAQLDGGEEKFDRIVPSEAVTRLRNFIEGLREKRETLP